ncbi:nectin-3 isoform X4 [Pseudopipra pipra]|uniref:nectin-3 isoform X4 n=1 Tax=Pseudopipra pipra TaxID=415032 RepID=UPI0031391FCE
MRPVPHRLLGRPARGERCWPVPSPGAGAARAGPAQGRGGCRGGGSPGRAEGPGGRPRPRSGRGRERRGGAGRTNSPSGEDTVAPPPTRRPRYLREPPPCAVRVCESHTAGQGRRGRGDSPRGGGEVAGVAVEAHGTRLPPSLGPPSLRRVVRPALRRAGAARPAPLSDTRSVWGGVAGAGSGTGRDRPGGVAAATASRARSMAGAGAAAEAAAGFPPSSAPAARRELFLAAGGGASPRWRQRRRRLRSAVPPGPGLGLLGLVFSRFCCTGASAVPGVQWHVQNLEALKWQSSAEGALAGPVVDPHVTAVWGKKVALKCIIDVNETITQVSWEKIYGKTSQTIAVHHPEYGISVQGEYQGRVTFKNNSLTDATIILKNVSFSDEGEYICKAVTFPLGNTQSSTTVTVLVEPVVSLTKGPNPLIDGANWTLAATCTAATGKPAAQIDWEGDLGKNETTPITPFPNETVTVVSRYVIKPTRFARGRHITCVVRHPALEKEIRYPYVLDIQYAPEVSVTGYDGNWFIGRGNVQLKCNADANPLPMEFMWTRLDGQWPEGLLSVNNTLQFSSPLTYNYTGTYICKVTNSLGQRSDQKTVYILDVPFKQTSSVAVAGAVIGAVLALFIITIFVTVLLTPRKKRPSYLDKVIDLPPTHKPSSCEERAFSAPQKEAMLQKEHFALQSQYREKDAGNLQHMKAVNGRQLTYEAEEPEEQEGLQPMYPVYQQTYYKNWSSRYPQNSGPGRVYINPREHYV